MMVQILYLTALHVSYHCVYHSSEVLWHTLKVIQVAFLECDVRMHKFAFL